MRLTAHFAKEEFDLDGAMPDECVPVYQALCEQLLEAVRTQFGQEVVITSGYRSPAVNQAAHGVLHSQHEANGIYCAADWKIPAMERDMRPVFDWIRETPEAIFDQLILEHDKETGTDIIHSSWSRAFNRRDALEGSTANMSAYTKWDAARGDPPSSKTDFGAASG